MVLKHFDSEFGISIKHFIGDGDSSVHKILNDAFIYKTITKIECRNHLIRNFGTKLIGIVTKFNVRNRKRVSPEVQRIQIAIRCAV